MREAESLWIFAYGSLIWRPGFDFRERRRAVMYGWRRRLCIYSWAYRGTREKPGLVFGLDRGGACVGVAYQAVPGEEEATLAYLRERELVTYSYFEKNLPVRLDDRRRVTALAYVADPAHEQYAGALDFEGRLALVRSAEGRMGRNLDYVLSTRTELRNLGIVDQDLERIAERLAPEWTDQVKSAITARRSSGVSASK